MRSVSDPFAQYAAALRSSAVGIHQRLLSTAQQSSPSNAASGRVCGRADHVVCVLIVTVVGVWWSVVRSGSVGLL